MFSCLLETYPGGILDHKADLCLLKLPSIFPKCLYYFVFSLGMWEFQMPPYPGHNLMLSVFLISAFLAGALKELIGFFILVHLCYPEALYTPPHQCHLRLLSQGACPFLVLQKKRNRICSWFLNFPSLGSQEQQEKFCVHWWHDWYGKMQGI